MKINHTIKTSFVVAMIGFFLTACSQPTTIPAELIQGTPNNPDKVEEAIPKMAEQNNNDLKLILNNASKPTLSKITSQELANKLKTASTGLLMPSESDYPFKPFIWKGQAATALTKDKLLKLTNHTPDTVVELTNLDSFFKNVTQLSNGQTPQEIQNVKKFRNLVKILKENFKSIQIFRVGSVEVEVYITGSNSTDYVGLSTKLIETL